MVRKIITITIITTDAYSGEQISNGEYSCRNLKLIHATSNKWTSESRDLLTLG